MSQTWPVRALGPRLPPTFNRTVSRWTALDGRAKVTIAAAAVGLVMFASSATAQRLTPAGVPAGAWWPAAGVSVGAAALTAGRRRLMLLVVIGLGSLLGCLVAGRPLTPAAFLAIADVAEAWIVGSWLAHGRLLTLRTLSDLGNLAGASAVGGAVAGALAAAGAGLSGGAHPWSTWPIISLAHATGVLVVVPLAISRPVHLASVRLLEFVAQWVITLGATALIFASSSRLPLPFLLLLIFVGAALRQGGRSAAVQLLAAGYLATLLTTHARGPFMQLGSPVSTGHPLPASIQGLLLLQVFLLACTVAVLAVALTASQREDAEAALAANEHFLAAVVETIDVGVVVVDPVGAPILFNRAFRQMYVPPKFIAGDIGDAVATYGLFAVDGVTPLAADEVPLVRVLAGEQVDGVEIVVALDDQPRRNVVVRGRQILADDGSVLGGVAALQDVTELKHHEAELKQALATMAEDREFERAVLDVVNAGVLACDADGAVRVRNATQRRLMGGADSESLALALAGESLSDLPARVGLPGAPKHDVLVTARQVRASDGRLLGAVAAFTDVTSEKVIEHRLRESVAFHDALLAVTPDVTYMSDVASGAVVWASKNIATTLGYTESAVRQMGGRIMAMLIHPEDVEMLTAANIAITALADGEMVETRYRIKVPTGEYHWVSRRATPFNRFDDGRLRQFLAVARDITDAVEIEDRLTDAALHDPLTGLPNRRLLADRLALALSRAARSGGEVAVLFCDLDGFKRINDSAGHAAGDVVLSATARRLQSAVRTLDTVARVGGDEFVIVADLVAPVQAGAGAIDGRAQAMVMAQRIAAALCEPVDVDGVDYSVTVSIGVTFAHAGGDADEALRDADTAMYRAKVTGKNRIEIFAAAAG